MFTDNICYYANVAVKIKHWKVIRMNQGEMNNEVQL